MELAPAQSEALIFLWCNESELKQLPDPVFVSDLQNGDFLAEFERNVPNLVSLKLFGIDP